MVDEFLSFETDVSLGAYIVKGMVNQFDMNFDYEGLQFCEIHCSQLSDPSKAPRLCKAGCSASRDGKRHRTYT
jgi:hypothetical protein